MEIKDLPTSQVNKRVRHNTYFRSYQSLTPPHDREFELTALFKTRGVFRPSHRQFSYMRQWLSFNGFKFSRHQGKLEFWTAENNRAQNDEIDKRTYTVESWAAIFLPGVRPPFTKDELAQFEKIMRSRGYRARRNGRGWYWSMKQSRRRYQRDHTARAKPPRYIRIPKGSFALLDLLEFNGMSRAPENFQWARTYLQNKGITRIHGTHRYAAPDERGKLPAPITGNWELPGKAFTTYEFQKLNNARKTTAEQWKSAVDFLAYSGYIYDPSWKRWRVK
jgi:hypothetical protein